MVNEKQKSVLVTGASGEIGRAICQKFIEEGYFVFAQGFRHMEELAGFPTSQLYSVKANLESEQAVKGMFEDVVRELSKDNVSFPQTLVHSVGISRVGLLQDMSVEDWDRVFNINTRSAFLCAREMIPHLLQADGGSMVFVSSFWGELGASCEVCYSASKGALNAFTKALAKELAPSQIRVNALACGAIDTKMNAWMKPEEKEALCEAIGLGRLGTAREAAEAVYYLASEKASYISGEVVRMDGAYWGA